MEGLAGFQKEPRPGVIYTAPLHFIRPIFDKVSTRHAQH